MRGLVAAALAVSGCALIDAASEPEGADADADTDTDTDSDSDSDTDTGTDTDTDTDTDSDTASDPLCDGALVEPVGVLTMNQVFFALDSADDFVELKNAGPADQPLTGWALATGPTRVYTFAAGLTVPTGGCVTLYWGPNDPCNFDEEACGVGGFVNDLTATGGDLALLRANDTDCRAALVDYVRWGDAEPNLNTLEPLAADAGQWPEGDSVDTVAWSDGGAIQYDGSGENGSTHWYVEAGPRRCE